MQFFSDAYLSHPKDNEIEICVFGPGYGESIVVYFPSIGWGVIDSCKTYVAGEEVNLPYQYLNELLSKYGFPKLAFVILTHPHEDHYKGLDKVILSYPGGVERVCRYDGDSIRELKAYIAKQKAGNSEPLPGLPEIFRSFNTAVRNGARFRRLSEMSIVFEKRDIDIPEYGRTDLRMIALGPTALSQEKYIEILHNAIPQPGHPVRPVRDSAHNLISVGLLAEAGNLRLIFGSDIEDDRKGELGWQAIIANKDVTNFSCNYVKVAHHGSRTGYCEAAWEKHSAVQLPISIVTPFNRGAFLPEIEVIDKIKEKSIKVGMTANLELDTKLSKYFKRTDVMAISRKTRSFKIQKPATKIGFIRTRFRLSGEIVESIAEQPALWL